MNGKQDTLTANTNSRTSVEGKIFPFRPKRLPSLRSELFGVLAKEVLATMHGIDTPHAQCLGWNEEWGFAILSATDGEDSVTDGLAGIVWYDWMQA